ncbi:MAG: hemerythrin domain-containing protein [Candidatus Bipolaricaulia bacterium]
MVDLTTEQEEEHRVVEEALTILKGVGRKFDRDEDVNPEIIEKVLDFLRTFADKCHHGKEEDLLFAALEMKGVSRTASPLSTLIREHEIARRYIQNIDRSLQDYKNGDGTARKDILQNINAYIELLEQHIQKEDELLYPMAEEKLGDEQKNELLDAYDRVEREIVGEGVHEKYHHMIEDLKEKVA